MERPLRLLFQEVAAAEKTPDRGGPAVGVGAILAQRLVKG